MRLLLIEDEVPAARMLTKGLRNEGYAVDTSSTYADAIYKAAISSYDLIILDVVLDSSDGYALCRELREGGNAVPILMLTARVSVGDRVRGLDAGADDYLTKPFDYTELLARARALLRRRPAAYVDSIEIGDLRLNVRARSATRAGKQINLTAKEYTILECLAQRKGALVSRAELSEHAWDENYDVFSNRIEVYILRLRKKIDNGHDVKLLRTRRGDGYMLSNDESHTGHNIV